MPETRSRSSPSWAPERGQVHAVQSPHPFAPGPRGRRAGSHPDRQYGRARLGSRTWLVSTPAAHGERRGPRPTGDPPGAAGRRGGGPGIAAGRRPQRTHPSRRDHRRTAATVRQADPAGGDKAEGLDPKSAWRSSTASAGRAAAISAAHGHGTSALVEAIEAALPVSRGRGDGAGPGRGDPRRRRRSPERRKSTLVNRMWARSGSSLRRPGTRATASAYPSSATAAPTS